MTDQISTDGVVSQLTETLNSRQLPGRSRTLAESLVVQLTSPVRITLMGTPDAPKRALANAIAGSPVVPAGGSLPTIELSYGAKAALRLNRWDGSAEEKMGHDFTALEKGDAAFIQVTAPLESLRDITLLDIVTDGSAAQQVAAANWAAPRTDIAIWATRRFDEVQRQLLQKMPSTMRDHNFLVPIVDAEKLPEYREGHEDFLGVYPVRRSKDGELVGDRYVTLLCKELRKCVHLGRQDDLAQAILFLNRFGKAERPAAETDPDARPFKAAVPVVNGSALETALEKAPDVGPTDSSNPHRQALDLIVSTSRDILSDPPNAGDFAERLTTLCGKIVEELSELVPSESPTHGQTLQAADYMILLDLEKQDDADDAAVAVLLQLKRAFEVELAA